MRLFPTIPAVLVCAAMATPSYGSIYFNGFFASLGLGMTYLKSNPRVNTQNGGQNQGTVSKMTPAAGGNLGFMTEVGTSTWVLGGELFFFKPFSKFKRGVGSGSQGQTIQINRRLGYGPAIMAGKLLNPKSAAYLKLGYELSKHSNHLVFGAGLKYAFRDRLHLGVEYGIAVISQKEIRRSSQGVASNPSAINAKMTEHRILFKISYQLSSPLVARDIPPQEPHKPN